MGDAQSAQRQGKRDAAAEEESGKVEDAQIEQNIENKPPKNNGQISEINGKADDSIAEVNGHCEEEIAAEAVLSPEDVSETKKPLKEKETLFKNVEVNEKPPNEADANEEVPLEITEIDAKQNDINESFRRFFSNIGLKLTVKRGSREIVTDVPDETNKKEPNRPEDVEDNKKETKSENAEHKTDANIAQETYDNDSTTCPTLTDATSEDVLENEEEKPTETKEEAQSDDANAATTSPVKQDADLEATPEEKPHTTSPSSPETEVVESPIKRFFTTGIFSGLRKKKKPAEDVTTEKELVDMGKEDILMATEQTVQDQQQDKDEISPGVEAAAVETEHKEEILSAESAPITDEGKSSTTDPSAITVTEPEILSSQEKEKIQASPLKRLLSGSSLKRLSKKQRSRKSSDAKLTDSGEHVSDQLLSSTESAENQKEEGPAQPSAAEEEDGAWASFKKLMTPKKLMKRSSLTNEETQIPGSVEEPKPSEGEQISDHNTEEEKKRKDSSVSWEAVLCGSGRRRSRKTSDSEDETPQIDNENKPDGGSKHGAESSLESSNEKESEIVASSPKQAGSPSEGDAGSTWKSFKRLVTPKRKAKDDDESKDNIQSDGEVSQEESSFSIKKLLPGRKKRKSVEKQDQVSSDEADKDVASGDEDSETPAVVPLSEFDTVETEVHIQTQADIESHIPEEADYGLQQDLLDQMAESVLPCDSRQTEAKKVQDNDATLEKQASTTPVTNEEPDDTDTSSKHQQLSDIPEEGIFTETPASVNEEAARDDTIADDLIEITSEAITAPEPLDITLADETEMISAVSQLSSESSKTSGNATPVPAECDIMETDDLLHQVVETISISPEAVPVCSDNLSSERIVVSDSHQILDTFVKQEDTILEMQRRLDVTTGLNVEKMDATNELAATAQTESTSEVNDSISTEIESEVPTEEFDTAEIAVDEVHDVNVSHTEESVKERIDGHHLIECLSEVNASVSTDILPEGEEIVPGEGSLVEAHQAETELPKMDSEEAHSVATAADETKDGAIKQEVQILTEMEDQNMHKITDQIQDQAPSQEEELQESAAVQTATLDSGEDSDQSPEKEVISETVTDDPKQTAEHLTQVSVEPENKEQPVTKTEHVQEPEILEAVQAPTLDSEEDSDQSPEKELKSEDVPLAETVADEPKQTAEHLTQVSVEPENKEQPVTKTEHVQEPEVLEAVQALTLNPEEGSGHSPEKEVISEDVPLAETVTDEPKQTAEHLTQVSVEPEIKEQPVNAAKTEHVQEPEVLEAVQAPTLDSEKGSVHSPDKEVILEDVPTAETVTDEPKQTAEHLTQVSVEPENKEQPVTKTEHVQEPEVLEAVQAPTLDSEKGSVHSPDKEVILEDVPTAEVVTDEPKQTAEHLTQVSVEPEIKEQPVNAAKTEHVQEPEVLEAVPALTLNPEEGSGHSPEKEVISEDVPPAETVTDEPKQTAEHLTQVSVEPEIKEQPVNSAKTEHVQEPEVLEAVQAPTLDSEKGSVHSPDKEVILEDVPTAETVTDEPKQTAEHLTEFSIEPENKEPVSTSKTENVQEPEVSEAVQAPKLDSEDGSVQSLEKEVTSEDVLSAEVVIDEPKQTAELLTSVQEPKILEAVQAATLDLEEGSVQATEVDEKSDDTPPAETVTDEPKQTAEHLTKVSAERENKEQPANAVKTEHVQEPEPLEAVQAPTIDSEESSVQSLENLVISQDVPEAETVENGPKEETMPLSEVILEQADASKTEHVQEVLQAVQAATLDSEVGSLLSFTKEIISEDIPVVETITEGPKLETEVRVEPEGKLPVEAIKTVLPSDVKGIVTETKSEEALMYVHVVTESIEGGSAHELASITDEIESEVMAQRGQALEIPEDQKTISQDVDEQEDCIPEVVDKLQTLSIVKVSSVNEEVLEQTVLTEETPALCVENAAVTDEPKHEVHLSAVQVSVQGEKESELPGTEIRTAAVDHDVSAAVEHATSTQIVTCNLKNVSAAIPDVLIEKTPDIIEPLIDMNELVIKEKVEAATPLMKDDEAETAEEGSVVVMMHVPSVQDNHRIQVQAVDDDMKSTLTIVDSVLEVGVTEAKEVIDVCLETIKKVDNHSATPETEQQLTDEENKVTIQELVQHVKENLPETAQESVDGNLEQEVIKQLDAVKDMSEMVESEPNEVEDLKPMEDRAITERQDETPSVINDDSVTEQQVSAAFMQEPDTPGSSDVSIHDHKEDLEETKTEWEKPETGTTAEEVKSSSEEVDVKKNHEQAQITQTAQSPIVTPGNTGLVVPQNTGIISSIGNVESPSSLSLEFKLNIQFGQTQAPASPPPTTERDVSEVRVQAVEAAELVKSIKTQRSESQKQTEPTEVTVQATEISKPASNLDSTERAVMATQPVLLDVGIQALETVEPIEQIKSTERVTSSVQATETIQPLRQTENVFLSRPVLSEAFNQETKVEESAKQTEEENDQDVWMDAEEVIYTQEETKVSLLEVEEPQTGSEQEEEAGLEHEVEMAPNLRTEEEESEQEKDKTGGMCEIDSEGEDFAVALEHPETDTVSITTTE